MRQASHSAPSGRASHRGLASLAALVGALCLCNGPAAAQQLQLLQDTETEQALNDYEAPLAKAAGLDPSAVRVYLIQDPSVNAFVAGGQNIFMQSGIILYVHSRNELVGVMAHETGHIRAGHLTRNEAEESKAMIPMIASTIVGVAAMALGGGSAGMAIMSMGQQIAEGEFTRFTYVQEGTADQIGVKLLNATHQSPLGMLRIFQRFANEEAMSGEKIPPFAQNHPVGQDRIEYLKSLVDASPYRDVKDSPSQEHAFEMIQAKLAGYVLPVDQVFNRYPLSNTSEPAHYARAMAYMRKPDFKEAFAEIDGLIKEEPDNPFFHEVLGQIYVTMSQPAKGVPEYQKSVDLLPTAPELRVELAAAQLATENPALVKPALDNLKIALQQGHENEDGYAWFQEAQAYSDLGNGSMADLSTAEMYQADGDDKKAKYFAGRAVHELPQGTPDWQRASDIFATASPNADGDN